MKMHRIHMPFRFCNDYTPFTHGDHESVETWFMQAAEYARLRYEAVKRYFKEIEK